MRQIDLHAKSTHTPNQNLLQTNFRVKTNREQKQNLRTFELGAVSSSPLYWHLYQIDNSSKSAVAPDPLLQQIKFILNWFVYQLVVRVIRLIYLFGLITDKTFTPS